ncbi:MAG: ABC transporter permease subunit [Deltaproteobacteria bacterium]|nr:MAG: ABC transporter permease subunit [Deltaproteobacteria bacterium]
MIEHFIQNELTRKRWRRFKNRKLAVISSIAILAMIVTTFIAPMLANSKPIYLSYQGNSYFPVLVTYNPVDFGITDTLVIDYRNLELGEDDFAVWPIIKWDPFESNIEVDSYPSPPTTTNLMGTDDRGRDVFTRILYGFKYSILYAVLVWSITTVVGIILGGIMGYFGGKIDFFGQRLVEILSTVPQFFLLIILISIFTPTLAMLVVISSVFSWIPISYYVRGEFLKNRKREFVEAARAMGASTTRIIGRHILPNSLTPVITFAPFAITANIVGLASLDFLGFGLEIPTPSWGELLSQAHKNFTIAWWLAVFPSLSLFFTLTFMNLIGEGVRDAMDPKMV